MAELVDALDSKSGELYAHEGSIPSWGTFIIIIFNPEIIIQYFTKTRIYQ